VECSKLSGHCSLQLLFVTCPLALRPAKEFKPRAVACKRRGVATRSVLCKVGDQRKNDSRSNPKRNAHSAWRTLTLEVQVGRV
jgi:hypothetical protein